jgi:hypothetical protein
MYKQLREESRGRRWLFIQASIIIASFFLILFEQIP